MTPYLLIQMALAFEWNPDLDNYTTFVVSMRGSTFQFIRSTCPALYIKDILSSRAPRAPLELYFSGPYDLMEQEDRKEFLRIYLGLIGCLNNLLDVYKD